MLEELIRQMTAYRIDEFDEDDDADVDIDLDAVVREGDKELEQKDEAVLISEVVEVKPAERTRIVEKPLEVQAEKNNVYLDTISVKFKTKCQAMQEQIEKGE